MHRRDGQTNDRLFFTCRNRDINLGFTCYDKETEILTLEVVTAAGSCSDTSKVFAGYSLIFDNITADTNFNIPEVSPCFSYTAQPVKNLGVFLTLSALPTEFTSVVVQKGGGIYVSN